MAGSSPIIILPSELITGILSFLPFKDIIVFSAVSRHFLELVRTSTTLQYIIGLGASGLEDSGQGNLTTVERLTRLQEHEHAWSTLKWRHSFYIPVGKRYIFWEFCGGIFVGSHRARTDFVYGHRTFDMIDIFELESACDNAKSMKTIPLSACFCSFSVDPGQNLLVLVEEPPLMPKVWIMHIRNLSDALQHPNTTCGIIQVPVAHEAWSSDGRSNGPGTIETQILGNALLYCQRRGPGLAGSISVFDWITGKMTLMIYPSLGDWCCALISEKYLLLLQRPGCRSQPCLELYDINPRSKWGAPIATYLLPFGNDDKWRSKACYGPASNSCTSETPARALRPFAPTRHPLLLAFRFVRPSDVGGVTATSSCLDMFLIPSKLLRHPRTNNIVEWEQWGPQSTRWFRNVLPNKWRRNIQGYRAVLPEKNVVLDFNPHNCTGQGNNLVIQPSHVPPEFRGSKPIVSSLPYRTLQPRIPFTSKNVLLDEHIICVETDLQEVGFVKKFLVLSF